MHIEQIIIEDFRSYSGRHVIDNLDLGHNAIVGANGSGKSSLLDAIAFILTSKYSPLPREKRRQLISNGSEGVRAASTTASVEIILNNEDKKLPHESTDVRIRRTIDDTKTDIITINKRVYTATELCEFLKSAFTPNNPYFIVEQDQITQLAMAPDERRFEILAITAGVDGMSEFLGDSVDVIRVQKQELINKKEDLTRHHELLQEQGEKSKEWHRIDKIKRYVQEKLFSRIKDDFTNENERICEKIEEKERELETFEAEFKERDAEFNKIKEKISRNFFRLSELEKNIVALKEERLKLRTELQNLEDEEETLKKKIQQYDGEVAREFEDRREHLNATVKDVEEEWEMLKGKLREEENSIKEKRRELMEIKWREVDLFRRRTMIERVRDKSMRAGETEMDLSRFEVQIQSQEKYMQSQENVMMKMMQQREEKEERLQKMRNDLKELRRKVEKNKNEMNKIKARKNNLFIERKAMQKEADDYSRGIEKDKKQLADVEKKFRPLVRREVREGMDSMKIIIKTWTDEGKLDDVEAIMGNLVDNFRCSEAVRLPVEIKAGDRLFHYVVRDRKIAGKIIDEIKKQNLRGLFSCIPLDTIRVQRILKPPGDDTRSLVEKLEGESEEIVKVLNYVFGKTMIARDLATGRRLIKEYSSLNFITLQGDQVIKPGLFKGGYIDTSISRIKLYNERKQLIERIAKDEEQLKSVEKEIFNVNEDINKELSELQKVELSLAKDERAMGELEKNLKIESEAFEGMKKNYEDEEKTLKTSKVELDSSRSLIKDLKKTNADDLDSSKIDEEIEELRDQSRITNQSIQEAENELSRLPRRLDLVEMKMKKLREEQNYLNDGETEYSIEKFKSVLKLIPARKRICKDKLVDVNVNLEKLMPEISELKETLEKMEQMFKEIELYRKEARMDLNECIELLEDLKTKRTSVQTKIIHCDDDIANLGPIPVIADPELYDDLSRHELEKNMKHLQKQEEKLGPVNRHAAEQFESIGKKLRKLEEIINEVEATYDFIRKSLKTLSKKRLETLKFCFECINRYFQDIFNEIVPTGAANLQPIWDDEEHLPDDEVPWQKVRGICIKATFSSEESMKNLFSLSGGQKTVLALAFIFAIQTLRPAPFYLFDEIDKTLDEAYRRSVAQIIHRMSENSQFFTITFRKEFLRSAGQFFKVTTHRGISRIDTCTREEAEEFFVEQS